VLALDRSGYEGRFAPDYREPNLTKVLLSWSSGKDSAWTLHLLRKRPDIQIAALVTTFNSEANRVAMHAVRRALVEAQAERTGIPLWAVELPWPCSNLEYEARMRAVCQRATAEGITAVAFGDLFLQEIRDYRVRQLQGSGLEPLFPVWQIPTDQLSRDMIAAGVKAKITCVDPSRSSSENCFLKAASAAENRIVNTARQSAPHEAGSNARRRASRAQPHLYNMSGLSWSFLARSIGEPV
jgi:diphthamide synthase (EF-2-diphthine--ammonia ligase)